MEKHALLVLSLVGLLFGTFTAQAQRHALHIDDYVNKELKVTKVTIDGEDHSYKLGMVKITDSTWEEYDHEGILIGKASILKISDHIVKIEWTEAKNGAKKGGVSAYHISEKDSILHFKIHHDSVHKGFFEVKL